MVLLVNFYAFYAQSKCQQHFKIKYFGFLKKPRITGNTWLRVGVKAGERGGESLSCRWPAGTCRRLMVQAGLKAGWASAKVGPIPLHSQDTGSPRAARDVEPQPCPSPPAGADSAAASGDGLPFLTKLSVQFPYEKCRWRCLGSRGSGLHLAADTRWMCLHSVRENTVGIHGRGGPHGRPGRWTGRLSEVGEGSG